MLSIIVNIFSINFSAAFAAFARAAVAASSAPAAAAPRAVAAFARAAAADAAAVAASSAAFVTTAAAVFVTAAAAVFAAAAAAAGFFHFAVVKVCIDMFINKFINTYSFNINCVSAIYFCYFFEIININTSLYIFIIVFV